MPDLPTVDEALESGLLLHFAGTTVPDMPPTSALRRVLGVLCHNLAVAPTVPAAVVAVHDESQFLDRVADFAWRKRRATAPGCIGGSRS